VRPTDSQLWKFLMIAHLAAATERQVAARAAVAGTVTIAVNDEVAIHGDPDGHLSGALRAARSVREQQPLQRVAHQIIGLYADRFTVCEPARVHFHRAKLTAPSDPDLWYWSGRGAARDGDWDTALSDWRECLKHSTRRLRPIIATAAAHISPREIRFRLLPDDAGVWLAATPYIFPDRQSEGRKEWLRAVVARWSQGPEPTDLASYLAWNNSLMELGEHDEAERLLRRVMERFPQEPEPRNRLASRLEADERYEDAVPILEWLAAHAPDRGDYRERLAAARHALKLKAEINTP
jgi:Flp pilus assembly protein TadD